MRSMLRIQKPTRLSSALHSGVLPGKSLSIEEREGRADQRAPGVSVSLQSTKGNLASGLVLGWNLK